MSDIPVGSPPAPPGRHAAPGGWYPDPLDGTQERYWDGWQWSRQTRVAEAGAGAQAGFSSGQPVPGGYGPNPQSGPYPQGQPGAYPPQGSSEPSYPQQPYPPRQYGQHPHPPQQYGQPPYPPQYGQPPYPPQPPMMQGGFGAGGVYTADGVPLASWWWRVLAVVIDAIIVAAIAALPSAGIYARLFQQLSALFDQAMRAAQSGQPSPVPNTFDLVSASDQFLLNLIAVAVGLAYHVLFVRFKGATPGKMLCRLRVVPTDAGRHRGALPWGTAVIRGAVWVLPKIYGLFLIFRLIDALFPLWHPKRQALHDLAAKTQVVRG